MRDLTEEEGAIYENSMKLAQSEIEEALRKIKDAEETIERLEETVVQLKAQKEAAQQVYDALWARLGVESKLETKLEMPAIPDLVADIPPLESPDIALTDTAKTSGKELTRAERELIQKLKEGDWSNR